MTGAIGGVSKCADGAAARLASKKGLNGDSPGASPFDRQDNHRPKVTEIWRMGVAGHSTVICSTGGRCCSCYCSSEATNFQTQSLEVEVAFLFLLNNFHALIGESFKTIDVEEAADAKVNMSGGLESFEVCYFL